MNTERLVGVATERNEVIDGQAKEVVEEALIEVEEDKGKHEVEISVQKFHGR